VLAGLISRQTNTHVAKTPGWGEMPVVGPLFSGRRATQEESELLILVTPEIVRPMDAEEVPPLPGHDVSPPNNCEFFKLGRTESGCPTLAPATPYGQNPNAATGFPIYNAAPETPTGTVPMTPAGVAPVMPPPVAPAPPASAQLQSLQRPIPASGSGDASVNGQSTTYYVPSSAPVQQVSGWFVVPVSNNAAAGSNAAAANGASSLQWYQRPFRSFASSQAGPQRPDPSNAITPVEPPTVPGALSTQQVQP
jgi:pilus assembly protein CpaC